MRGGSEFSLLGFSSLKEKGKGSFQGPFFPLPEPGPASLTAERDKYLLWGCLYSLAWDGGTKASMAISLPRGIKNENTDLKSGELPSPREKASFLPLPGAGT